MFARPAFVGDPHENNRPKDSALGVGRELWRLLSVTHRKLKGRFLFGRRRGIASLVFPFGFLRVIRCGLFGTRRTFRGAAGNGNEKARGQQEGIESVHHQPTIPRLFFIP